MTREQTVAVWQGQVRIRVLSDGAGPPLIFFHGPWGVTWDPFLAELAKGFTVYAPEHPGTAPGTQEDIYHLDGLWDLVLCYDELLRALKLDEAVLVGHSFGGMVACEMAAAYPRRATRLVLIDPIGFWRDTEKVVHWMTVNPAELPAYVFRDPNSEAAKTMFGFLDPGSPPAEAAAARVRVTWAMGATGKFTWPIPDKGLKKRIHRVSAPTLVVWGKEDRLVPPVYADEFTRRIPGARAQTVDGAAHAPHLEQPERVARMIREFAG